MNMLKLKTWKIIFWIATFILHLVLLTWILWVLQQSGLWSLENIFWHFMGLSSFGAVLIMGTAKITKYIHLLEWKKYHKHKKK